MAIWIPTILLIACAVYAGMSACYSRAGEKYKKKTRESLVITILFAILAAASISAYSRGGRSSLGTGTAVLMLAFMIIALVIPVCLTVSDLKKAKHDKKENEG